MAKMSDLFLSRGDFEPGPPESLKTTCQCPHCGGKFPFEKWNYDQDAYFCEDCNDFHSGFVCPNDECAEVIGAAGYSNGKIKVLPGEKLFD